jgi:hypothetical protein
MPLLHVRPSQVDVQLGRTLCGVPQDLLKDGGGGGGRLGIQPEALADTRTHLFPANFGNPIRLFFGHI